MRRNKRPCIWRSDPNMTKQAQSAQPHRLTQRGRLCLLLAAFAFVCLVLLLFVPPLRESLQSLLNRLFSASEAVNNYLYDHYAVSENTSAVPAAIVLTLIFASLCGIALAGKRHVLALLLAAALALGQAYYGLSLPLWANLLLFAFLGAAFWWEVKSPGLLLIYGSAVLILALAVSLLAPGVDAALEARSEHWRDELSIRAMQISQALAPDVPEVPQTARPENRVDLEEGAGGTDFELHTEYEQEIAKPSHVNWLRILLISILILLLLTLPFLPFFLAGERRKIALARRKAFTSEDNSEAARAMFLHSAAYIESCYPGDENGDWSTLSDRLPSSMQSYRKKLEDAGRIWLQAAYSGKSVDEEQRSSMRAFLDETEELLYDKAELKKKLRLKYIECLHE